MKFKKKNGNAQFLHSAIIETATDLYGAGTAKIVRAKFDPDFTQLIVDDEVRLSFNAKGLNVRERLFRVASHLLALINNTIVQGILLDTQKIDSEMKEYFLSMQSCQTRLMNTLSNYY